MLLMFSSNPAELHKQLNGNGIHQLKNIITLDHTLHKAFDTGMLWFKPVDVCPTPLLSALSNNCYRTLQINTKSILDLFVAV